MNVNPCLLMILTTNYYLFVVNSKTFVTDNLKIFSLLAQRSLFTYDDTVHFSKL